jgi:hypothetical protein
MCNTTSNLDDAASLTDVPVMIETKDSANAKAEHEESMERIGALIQDLFHTAFPTMRLILAALVSPATAEIRASSTGSAGADASSSFFCRADVSSWILET